MARTEIAKINLRDRLVVDVCTFISDNYSSQRWTTFRIEDPLYTDTPTFGMTLSPAKSAEIGAALIAAARAAGWVQPAVEVVREVEVV